MEILSNPFHGSLKRYQKRRAYTRIEARKTTKNIQLGGGSKRSWKIKVVPKLRVKGALLSPLKLWGKLKNAYVNMMISLAGNAGKRNRKVQKIAGSPINDFENRLAFEIYKALMTSS